MRKLSLHPYLIYLLKFGGFFCLFYFGTLLIIALSSKENLYSPFVARYLDYVRPLRTSVLWCSDQLLRAFHYSTDRSDEFTLGLKEGQSVRMVYSCVGYGVLSFWAAFVFANQGSFLKKASWIFSGWALLWVLNVLRIFFLILAINQNPMISFAIDHHTIFNAVAYGFIFLLIYFYARTEKRSVAATASL